MCLQLPDSHPVFFPTERYGNFTIYQMANDFLQFSNIILYCNNLTFTHGLIVVWIKKGIRKIHTNLPQHRCKIASYWLCLQVFDKTDSSICCEFVMGDERAGDMTGVVRDDNMTWYSSCFDRFFSDSSSILTFFSSPRAFWSSSCGAASDLGK